MKGQYTYTHTDQITIRNEKHKRVINSIQAYWSKVINLIKAYWSKVINPRLKVKNPISKKRYSVLDLSILNPISRVINPSEIELLYLYPEPQIKYNYYTSNPNPSEIELLYLYLYSYWSKVINSKPTEASFQRSSTQNPQKLHFKGHQLKP